MCFQLVRPPPEPARSLTSPPRCTSSSHLCWQRSKDRSEQRLSARAVLIGGSCSLKRLLNNVKKLCRIFKSLLSEPSSSLAPPPPPQAHVHLHPGDVLAPKGAILSPCLVKSRSPIGVGRGTRLHPFFSPKGGGGMFVEPGRGELRPPPSCCTAPASTSGLAKKKSHWQSWFQGKWVSGVVPGVFPTLTAPRTPCSAAGPRRRHGHEPWDGLVRRASVPLPCLPAILMARREK